MESERYSWSISWIRSDFKFLNADDAYADAAEWCRQSGYDVGKIKIWVKKIEEVYI